jgi:hypothetical protein|tara:strand:- start:694 stop:1077 length:384 start_codon:yes stop_codon:yes gene_type:complete
MASNVRFVDNLKVGAYAVQTEVSTTVDIDPNINNYVLTATGTNTIAGEEQLQFDGLNLGIGGASAGARFEINDITGNDLLLIKNASNQGIKIDSVGVFQLFEFDVLPTAVEGGVVYNSNNFWVGTST